MKVVRVPVPARRLLTLREDHPVWTSGPGGPDVGGALVRLHPPADVPEQDVAEIVARLERVGAVRVKVVSRTPAPEVVRRIDVDPSAATRLSHRDAVLAAAAEARSSDPAALRELLEGILDEEGI